MTTEQRKCLVQQGPGTRDIEGVFIQYGTKILYDESNRAHTYTTAIVEADDGRVLEVYPSAIRFLKA